MDDTSQDPQALIERVTDHLSRRRFLSSTAAAGGALALGAGNAAAAQSDDESEDDEAVTDVDILNFALLLEKLEAEFYTEALEEFDELPDFERPGTPGGEAFEAPPLQYGTYGYLERIRDHERAHVETLTDAIEATGSDPITGLEFEFPYETPAEFVGIGVTLENTGVAAYAGAAPAIEDEDLLKAALSIHSVEARHAAYLGVLDERLPYPNGAFDPAKSMAEVERAVAPFVVGMDDGDGEAKRFRADLAGENEVPPVDTAAAGESTLEFSTHDDDPHVHYTLHVSDIEDVTQAHIHVGGRDENGPVVAFLFGKKDGGEFVGPLDEGVDVSGSERLVEGAVRADDLVGPLEGEDLDALLEAMRAENAYVNVHTTEHPPGEIRGQTVPEQSTE